MKHDCLSVEGRTLTQYTDMLLCSARRSSTVGPLPLHWVTHTTVCT